MGLPAWLSPAGPPAPGPAVEGIFARTGPFAKLSLDLKLALLRSGPDDVVPVWLTFAPPAGTLSANDFFSPSMTVARPESPDSIRQLIAKATSGTPLTIDENRAFSDWSGAYLVESHKALFAPYMQHLAEDMRQIPGVVEVDAPSPAIMAFASATARPLGVLGLAAMPEADSLGLVSQEAMHLRGA